MQTLDTVLLKLGQHLQVSVGAALVILLLLAYVIRQGLKLKRQRQKAAAALRASEEKYRLLVEGSAEGILLVLEDRPVYANRTLLERLGYTAQELTEMPLEKIVELPAGSGASATTPERRANLLSKNGAVTPVLLAAAPITLGNKTGQILSLKDAGVRQKTEETLARLVADLQSMLPLATRAIRTSPLPLVTCAWDTPITQAAAIMDRAQCSAILVNSPAGEPVGIVTDHDLRHRVLAAEMPASAPVSAIMSAPLVRIPDHALLFEAARVMQERNVRHLVVTDERGGTVGILTGTEILHAQRHAIGALLAGIQEAASPEALRESRARLPIFVKALLESGAKVEIITRIMTAVSDGILARLAALAEAELGPPPATYAFVALGSEARAEQTLATDQDNAIIYADVGPERDEAVQAYFLRLGEKVCSGLDLAGYRRCQRELMASSPKWCQPLSRWQQYFADCVSAGQAQDLLELNAIFDFRCAHGAASHVVQLRQHLHSLLEGSGRDTFFFHLAQNILQFRPPRGFFGNIRLETSGTHAAAFNIKTAIIPLVNFARLYALRHRIAETNTLERLHRLREQGLLLPSSHDELAQAFTTLMQMRLAHQAGQVSRGLPPDNYIEMEELTQLERAMLKKVFADITVFQARLQTDFARTA